MIVINIVQENARIQLIKHAKKLLISPFTYDLIFQIRYQHKKKKSKPEERKREHFQKLELGKPTSYQ